MSNASGSLARRVALGLVLGATLGALGCFWWLAEQRSDIAFLPERSPAHWITYAAAPQAMIQSRAELPTVFRGEFNLKQTPASAEMALAGFHRYQLAINGRSPGEPRSRGKTWKAPDRFEVSSLLRPGNNQIVVTVFNSNGPPVLWLTINAGEVTLNTSERWMASHAGATPRLARRADQPNLAPPGNPLSGGPKAGDALEKWWPLLLAFTVFSAACYWFVRTANAERREYLKPLVPAVILGAWVVLFLNNLGALPNLVGYDVTGHLEYIGYLLTRRRLPLANEGWEMFQPPLYYLLCTGGVQLTGLVSLTERVVAMRIFGLVIGLGHLWIVWGCLRRLFPGRASEALWGILFAACLPPMIYLTQFVTNEGLAAALVSAAVYLTLRLLKDEHRVWWRCAALGACLGAALLTKSTALLALPPILGALLWRWMALSRGEQSAGLPAASGHPYLRSLWPSLGRVCVILATCALVCGWHYYRVWAKFGNPLIGVWDPRSGFSWWQEPGHRTSAFYLSFGQGLVQPWFSAMNSFWDGIYTTLWGDGLLGGAADHLLCPPWNYDLIALGFWLALLPTVAVIAGLGLAVWRFVRAPSPEWFLVLGLGFLAAVAVVHLSLTAPYCCTVKAFYGLVALVPLAALAGLGLAELSVRVGKLRPLFCVLAGVWGFTVFASFWIARNAPATLAIQARAMIREGRPTDAESALRARLLIERDDPDLWELLAEILALTGRPAEALAGAEFALKNKPEDASKHLTAAMALGQLRRTDEAIAHARRALELAPGYVAAFPTLASLLQQQEAWLDAERVAREGLANAPGSIELHLALATSLAQTRKIEEAGSQLEMVVALQPGNPRLLTQVGATYDLMGRTHQAIARYAEALRLDANLIDALNNLAWIRATHPDAQFRDGAEAVTLAARACETTGYRQPLLIGTLAAAYAESGRFDDAVAMAEKARDLALAAGQAEVADKNTQLLANYRAHRPHREAAK